MALEKEEYLWRMVNEHMTQARQQETLRSSMTTLLITISGAIIAFITYDKDISSTDIAPALLLFCLGIYGVIFSAKHYERFNFHIARVREYRNTLEKYFDDISWRDIRATADVQHEKRFPRLVKLRQHKLWLMLHLINTCFGLFLTLLILIK